MNYLIFGHFFSVELRILEDNWELQSSLQKIKLPKEEINKLEVDGISKNYSFYYTFYSYFAFILL